MKVHVFDTIGPEPGEGTQVLVHCGKFLSVKSISEQVLEQALEQGDVEKCARCFDKSRRFTESHWKVSVQTVFIKEKLEPREGATVTISKHAWQALLRGERVAALRVFSEDELKHHQFGDNPKEFIVRVKITPVAD